MGSIHVLKKWKFPLPMHSKLFRYQAEGADNREFNEVNVSEVYFVNFLSTRRGHCAQTVELFHRTVVLNGT